MSRRTPRRLALALLPVAAVALSGCQSNGLTREGMPPAVTRQGQTIATMWQGSWLAAWAVGIVVWGGILWAIAFHRKRGDKLPEQVRYNLPIEIMYTVLPFIMIGVLFYFAARNENTITSNPPHPQVVVRVTGEQWTWIFQYPQYPVTNPAAAYPEVTQTGATWNPATPNEYANLPLLVIPEHETVQFRLYSPDVVHAFWIVPFEFKRDVIPGFRNTFTVNPTATGSFIGRCTELCGVYHSRMLFRVKIVTRAQFRQWILATQAQQNAHPGSTQ